MNEASFPDAYREHRQFICNCWVCDQPIQARVAGPALAPGTPTWKTVWVVEREYLFRRTLAWIKKAGPGHLYEVARVVTDESLWQSCSSATLYSIAKLLQSGADALRRLALDALLQERDALEAQLQDQEDYED